MNNKNSNSVVPNNSKTPDTLKEITERVREELEKKLDYCEFGSENSLIFDGGDCKVLCYVVSDENNNIGFDYYDYFPKGEYSIIHDDYMEESLTSHRGFSSSVDGMLEDLNLETV